MNQMGRIVVSDGTICNAPGRDDRLVRALRRELMKQGLANQVELVRAGCVGLCDYEPVVLFYPEGQLYTNVSANDATDIVQARVMGEMVTRLLPPEGLLVRFEPTAMHAPFFHGQERIALRNCGVINPEDIDEYIERDGYQALAKALTKMTPQEVIDEVRESGLRGRGGAGFPTGLKWAAAAKEPSPEKYLICNADEGDPGAFMDRSVLESDPHSVIEAMAIAGYAIGAKQGFVYVRAEYPVAYARLQIAIAAAKERGLLGEHIFGSGFSFDIELRVGAGAFVCGEETALIASIEGRRGMPRPKPPYPAEHGLWGMPTVINNVETLANIPPIILRKAQWFASIGTPKSKGTKVFALGGQIHNTGLVEVPMGTALRTVIEDIGGGVPNGRKLKAVQTGGPSGGCIPASEIDSPIDYETLVGLGSMMGSGGMIVMDDSTCMVDVARFYLEFTTAESCGQCAPCRIGTVRMLELLTRITSGEATLQDLDDLEVVAREVAASSLCGLGQGAPNPVLSTLRYFRDEYLAHVLEKRCPAKVCKPLVHYSINAELCTGCGLCSEHCPAGAITGELKHVHVIDDDVCTRCGTCLKTCNRTAVVLS